MKAKSTKKSAGKPVKVAIVIAMKPKKKGKC
jgi:hypothetical protein